MLLLFQKYEDNVCGNLGHIIVTLDEHGEMTHEKHSLSFAVKFHACKPNSAVGFVQSIGEQRIVHDFEEHIKLKQHVQDSKPH